MNQFKIDEPIGRPFDTAMALLRMIPVELDRPM
jgi:hypothetical protein